MSRIVIALGGNALGNTAKEQLQLVTETAKAIVDLIEISTAFSAKAPENSLFWMLT